MIFLQKSVTICIVYYAGRVWQKA